MLSFWSLVQFLFLVCFFCAFPNEIDIDYQPLASSQQIIKKKKTYFKKMGWFNVWSWLSKQWINWGLTLIRKFKLIYALLSMRLNVAN